MRILATFGDSKDINLNVDRQFIDNLRQANAEPEFLVKPDREKFDRLIWDEKGWDILFFAGHSYTENGTGRILINQNYILEINDLKYALQEAISGGLHLAIFNSCDGLGLAHSLVQLNIPQIIVMRFPVPDLIAQEFLRNFLKAFTEGKSLYSSVRIARERLQGLEAKFPYASWIPIIYQNPAVVPSTWQELSGSPSSERGIDYTHLQDLLAAGMWREADEETFQVMLKISGREKESCLDPEDWENIPCLDLDTIDSLWVKHSDGHFGFSVQKSIWESFGGKEDSLIYRKFGDYVGWRKNGTWRNYPNLIYTLNSPRGHLPYKWVEGDVLGLGWLGGKLNLWSGKRVATLAWRLSFCSIWSRENY